MAYEFDFTEANGKRLFLGDDFVIELEVFDSDGLTQAELDAQIAAETVVMKDVAGYALRFAVKKKDATADPALIDKTTVSGITITGTFNVARGTNTQRVRVAFADTDSDPAVTALKAGTFRYACKRTDAGSEKTLAFGDFEFLAATTRA